MRQVLLTLSVAILAISAGAHARNDFKEYSISDAFELEAYQDKLGDDIVFHFGNDHRGKVLKTFGTWPTQKKTNAFNKSDEFACQWAMLSALIALRNRARKEGGNAVINIISNNDHVERSSSTTFQCEVGNIIASVALKGTVVRLD